jgi:hypothetical protein
MSAQLGSYAIVCHTVKKTNIWARREERWVGLLPLKKTNALASEQEQEQQPHSSQRQA